MPEPLPTQPAVRRRISARAVLLSFLMVVIVVGLAVAIYLASLPGVGEIRQLASCPRADYGTCIRDCEAGASAQCPAGQSWCAAADAWKAGCPSGCAGCLTTGGGGTGGGTGGTGTFDAARCTNTCKNNKNTVNGGVVGGRRSTGGKADYGVPNCECFCQGVWRDGGNTCDGGQAANECTNGAKSTSGGRCLECVNGSWRDCGTTGGTGTGTGTGGGAGVCPNPPNLPAVKYVKFTCPNGCTRTTEGGVTAYRCYANRVESSTPLSLGNACGQVDVLSGTSDSTYCGYTEYTCGEARCQGTTTTPPTQPPGPTPTPTPRPVDNSFVCGGLGSSRGAPAIGDNVSFTCSAAGPGKGTVTKYNFRYKVDAGEFQTLAALSGQPAQSETLRVALPGRYLIQCQACNAKNECSAWSSI